MQLRLFKNHEYKEFFNYIADATVIIENSEHSFCLPPNATVLMVINNHAIWYYNQEDGNDPDVYFWSTRSLKSRKNGKLSEFIVDLI